VEKMAVARKMAVVQTKSKKYVVGIAELAVAPANNYLVTIGLGSCVATVIWDKRRKIGGMIHTILPSIAEMPPSRTEPKTKFADSGIPILIDKVIKMGGRRRDLVAKIAGGSQMFAISSMMIGKKNVKSAKKTLMLEKMPIIAEDVFGTQGRTIIFDTSTGIMIVKRGSKEIRKI
jgi:chemotaxis protein CheD